VFNSFAKGRRGTDKDCRNSGQGKEVLTDLNQSHRNPPLTYRRGRESSGDTHSLRIIRKKWTSVCIREKSTGGSAETHRLLPSFRVCKKVSYGIPSVCREGSLEDHGRSTPTHPRRLNGLRGGGCNEFTPIDRSERMRERGLNLSYRNTGEEAR